MTQHSTSKGGYAIPIGPSSTPQPLLFSGKKIFTTALLLALCMAWGQVQAQLTGTKTVPGDYATVAAAVTDLNAQGVGAGGVTFNVAANHTETLTGRITLTATGTMANPIVFQKSGAGANPLLTSYVGVHPTGDAENDGMFCLLGSDWVTIDGIDLKESVANTDETTTMEYGYGMFKTSDTDGCQNNTFKNCTITLNRVNNGNWATTSATNGSVAFVINNTLVTSVGTGLTITAPSGTSSFNKFYSNTIQNCNTGMAFDGYNAPSPFDLADQGNDIGGSSPATGNTILNYGGGGTANGAAGVYTIRQWGVNCSYNTINNNDGGGVNHGLTLWGILLQTATSSSAVCNNNNITVHGGATSSAVYGIQISVGTTAAGNTIDVKNNMVTGDYLTATSGTFYGINTGSTATTVNLMNNTVSNTAYGSLATTSTGANYLIYNSSAAANVNAIGNTVSNHSRLGTTGGITVGIYISSGANQTVKHNNVNNISTDGTGATGTMYGIQTTTGTIVVDSNTVNDLNILKTSSASAMYGIYNALSPTNENYNHNTVFNLTNKGTGTTYGIFTNTTTGIRTLSYNLVHTISSASTTVAGIAQTTSSPSIFNNKVYNIQSTSSGAPTVSGLVLTSLGTAGVANIYNNLIGDINAPNANTSANTAPSVRGINITSTTTNSSINISYNTVWLSATSGGANFSTAALFVTTSATGTTSNLTLKNNIFSNNSTPNGTGQSVAYQRSSTSLANYDATSNNNLFYAGAPSATNLIFYDGTNASQTLASFKALVAPRETASVSENPKFLSTMGSSADFLHLDPAFPTQAESGGITVAGITDDYDGNLRNVSTPDIGADEGSFIAIDLTGPNISYTDIPNSICVDALSLSADINDATGVNTTVGTKPRIWFKKSTELNVLPATNTAADNGWKYVEATNASSPFAFSLNYALLTSPVASGDVLEYFVVAQDVVGTPNVGTNTAIYNSAPTSVALGAGAFPVSSVKTYSILAAPVSIASQASPNTICISGDVALSLTGDPSTGASYQWQSSPKGANTWSDIPGATTASYVATGVTASTDYRCVISCGGGPIAASPSTLASVDVNSPAVLTTTPASACGAGPFSLALGATASAGATLNWYDMSSGGNSVGTGTTFNTPAISTTTTYYVAASEGGGNISAGRPNPQATSTGFNGNNYGLVFDATQDFTITSVQVYPTTASGAITVQLQDNSGAVLQTAGPFTLPPATGTTYGTGATPTTLTLNFAVTPGTGYRLASSAHTGSIIRDNPISGFSYPSAIGSVGNLTAGLLSGTPNTNTYYFFFDWVVATGCESARVPVVASVGSATNTWNGGGNGTTWDDPANWSDGIVPLPCQNVVIPTGDVTVPTGFEGKGLTLDVATGALLTVPATGLLDIKP
ncbi:MAG: hypothetical protein H6577_28335 [Lewinellaceae bacterium]|nr:hypothetical protein [Saprospiraceae bacterium]MCB9342056.1 hypothetical protein [Lewinellaceae bacterium]